MLETSARLLELLSLLQSRPEWSGAELAQRLGVGPRTIRRDVERLRALGYPVNATRGVAGGYRLGAGASLPPLLLDDEEAVAVAAGLRAATSVGIAGIEEISLRALSKLEQVLPSRLRRRVNALGAATVPYPGTGPTVDPESLAVIAGACRDHQRLRFAYQGHARPAGRGWARSASRFAFQGPAHPATSRPAGCCEAVPFAAVVCHHAARVALSRERSPRGRGG